MLATETTSTVIDEKIELSASRSDKGAFSLSDRLAESLLFVSKQEASRPGLTHIVPRAVSQRAKRSENV